MANGMICCLFVLTRLPWWLMTLLSPVWSMAREMREMRYLYDLPHQISSTRFNALLPDFQPTDLRTALRDVARPADGSAVPVEPAALDAALGGFAALDTYRASWRRPDTIRGMCADYRAALDFDFDDHAADLSAQVNCPALVLYGADGPMARNYDVPGSWAPHLSDMRSDAITGGHFFIDTNPKDTLAALQSFLST